MSKSRRSSSYPSPFVAVFELGGNLYAVTERTQSTIRGVKLNPTTRAWVQSALDDTHADLEAHLLGFHRKLGMRHSKKKRGS